MMLFAAPTQLKLARYPVLLQDDGKSLGHQLFMLLQSMIVLTIQV
jgi:hypothetical protein